MTSAVPSVAMYQTSIEILRFSLASGDGFPERADGGFWITPEYLEESDAAPERCGGGGFAGLVSARHGLWEHRLGRVEIARGAERDSERVDRRGEQAPSRSSRAIATASSRAARLTSPSP